MTKLSGGLRAGIKQQDMTRRLDDNLSSSDFAQSRRSTLLRKYLKGWSEKLCWAFVICALLFGVVRFTLNTFFLGKVHAVLAPILGNYTAPVERVLTGSSQEDKKDDDVDNDDAKKIEDKPPPLQAKPKHNKKHGHKKHA